MPELSAQDYEAAIELVSRTANPTSGLAIPERKRLFAHGAAVLIDADVWMWSSVAMDHDSPGVFAATCQIDEGWKSEGERSQVHQFFASEKFNGLPQTQAYQALQADLPSTWLREELFPTQEWAPLATAWSELGLHGLLLSYHPVDEDLASSVVFCRRGQKPGFGPRERQIVALLLGQVEWLHRHGYHPDAQRQVVKLSPRERQVLALMLNGDSRKKIAVKLGIREYTVAGYQKKLHRSFGVTSRAELQAYFFHGAPADPPAVARGEAPTRRVGT